jgi:hypothetical protein
MLLTQTTKGKSSATSHNQTRYMVLLSVLLQSELFRHWCCSNLNRFMCTLLYFVSVRTGMWSMVFTRLSYCSCRGTSPWEVCTLITECRFQSGLFLWTFLWFWIIFSSSSHWNVCHMLDGSDSIPKFCSKITPFETTNWILSVRMSSKNMSILSDRFDQTQNKP